MGLSGFLLKRKDEIDPLKILGDVVMAAKRAGLMYILNDRFYYNNDGSFRYTTGNLTNRYTKKHTRGPRIEDIIVYVYGMSDSIYDGQYDFLIPNGALDQAVFFEKYADCERILLEFLYKYLILNPKDIFWGALDWYYTLEDIEIIRKRDFDWDWPYIKPDWK